MNKTYKIKKNTKLSKTKKCPISLKSIMVKKNKYIINKNNKGKSSIQLKKEFVKNLLSSFAPHSIKPNDNFYDYINYQWLKNITLDEQKKYIVQVDDFRLIQDNVYHQLDNIILDYIKTNNNKLSKNLKNFYNSVIKMNSINDGIKLSKDAIKIVDKYIEENNPWNLLAFYNKDEIISSYAPLVWSINPDDKDPNIFRCYISPHKFILIDLNVYYNDRTEIKYKNQYRNEFEKYIKKVFDTCLGDNHKFNPSDIFEVEVEIFNALGCIDITNKEEQIYNKVFKKDCLEKYNFDWYEFTKCLGFKKTPNFFITSSLNYLKCGCDLFLKNWNCKKWRTYWIFLLLKKIVRLTKDWEKISFYFYGKYQRGQESINKSNAVSSSLYMSIPFNTFLTNQYIEKYSDKQKTEYVKVLSHDLLECYKNILDKNNWLSPKTKKYALYKLNKFKFIIGKPDNLREDPDLDYDNNLYNNIEKIINWRFKKFIELEGKPVIDIPTMDWTQYPIKMTGTQAYIVNASYTPSKNAIYINQGYIQKPFIDLDERGIEYNLAHIGFTLSHEMSHGFDNLGSQYNAEGKLENWWTNNDKKIFKNIQKDIINQYEEFALRDGIKFDASIGVGEDMADISGIAICDSYLRNFQIINKDIVPIRSLGFQGFYTYFAIQQKQYLNKKAISAQLKTNPHPLDKYRCNIPLSRSIIFRSLFNVKKGDGMWWHNLNTIW
jgi:predicted metalloendopeptidase